MHISKEVRIGVLVTISIVVFCCGFYLLKGINIFSSEKEYYCYYASIEGLQPSANVQIRGLNVGRVSKIALIDKGVKVVIAIKKDVDLPKGTIAKLASSDLLGGKVIRLDLGTGPGNIEGGEPLATAMEGGVIDNISAQINPLITEVRVVVAQLDTTLMSVNNIVGDTNQQAITRAIASLENTAANFASVSNSLKNQNGQITGIIKNANSITTNLAGNNDNINHILTNFNNVSDQMAKAPIQQTFADLQKTTAQLQGIINKINNNEGSLGMIVNNKDLYNNLTNSLSALNNLMTDMQAHPSRYINVTIFGKKKP